MTRKDLLERYLALKGLSVSGFTTGKLSKKVARMLIWAKGKKEEYEEIDRLLLDGCAERDEKGNKVAPRRKDEETGEWRDGAGFVIADSLRYEEESRLLLLEEITTNGMKITDTELKAGLKEYPPEPAIYAGLGELFDWDAEEEETPPPEERE